MSNRTKAASAPSGPKAPSWHELVQAGPKGDPQKKAARLAARRVGTLSTKPEHQPKSSTGRSYSAGMTVLHRTRLKPLHNDMPRPDVLRRQLIRKLRAQGVTVIEEAKQVAA